jgi:chromosome segregation ATPase
MVDAKVIALIVAVIIIVYLVYTLTQKNTEIDQLKTTIEKNNKVIEEANKKTVEYQKKYIEVEAITKQLIAAEAELKAKLEELQRGLAVSRAEASTWKTAAEEHRNNLSVAQQEAGTWKATAEEQNAKLIMAQREASTWQAAVEDLTAQYNHVGNLLRAANNKITDLNEEIIRCTAERDDLEKRFNSLRLMHNSILQDYDAALAENARLTSELQQRTASASVSAAGQLEMRQLAERRLADLNELKATHEAAVAKYQAEAAELNKRIQVLLETHSNNLSQQGADQTQAAMHAEQLATMAAEIDRLRSTVNAMSASRITAHNERLAALEQLAAARKELETVMAQLKEARTAAAQYLEQLAAVVSSSGDSETIMAMRAQIDSLSKQLTDMTQREASASRSAALLRADIRKLEASAITIENAFKYLSLSHNAVMANLLVWISTVNSTRNPDNISRTAAFQEMVKLLFMRSDAFISEVDFLNAMFLTVNAGRALSDSDQAKKQALCGTGFQLPEAERLDYYRAQTRKLVDFENTMKQMYAYATTTDTPAADMVQRIDLITIPIFKELSEYAAVVLMNACGQLDGNDTRHRTRTLTHLQKIKEIYNQYKNAATMALFMVYRGILAYGTV